jgi:hypothetical protein
MVGQEAETKMVMVSDLASMKPEGTVEESASSVNIKITIITIITTFGCKTAIYIMEILIL